MSSTAGTIPLQFRTFSRKRRGSVTPLRYLPPGAIIIVDAPVRTPVGKSGRSSYQQPRATKLSPAQFEAIQQQLHRSPRELAAEFGVSHETIRKFLREHEQAVIHD